MDKTNNPKRSKDVTQTELSEIAELVIDIFIRLIKTIEPAKKRPNQVQLALLTKMLRMYKNMFRVADYREGDIPPLIARQIFEFAVTFCYLVVNHEDDNDIYNKFANTSFVRLHLVLKAMENPEDPFKEFSSPEVIKVISQVLESHGYNVDKEKGSKIPSSWHPDKSYRAMAYELGDKFQAMYDRFYSLTSTAIHPDWLDLERSYLTYDKKGRALANHETPNAIIFPLASATCMMLDTAEVCVANFIKQGGNKEKNVAFDKEIRMLHYRLHNDDEPPEDEQYNYV